VSRIPIRWRLTVTFAGVMAIVIAAIGLLLYARFESELNRSIDDGLRGRVHALAALVAQQPQPTLSLAAGQRLLAREDTLAQVIDPDGRIIAATTQVAHLRLLSAGELARARRGVVMLTRRPLADVAKRARIAAEPAGERGLVVVVAHSLKDREGANESFARALLIAGPLALLFAAAAGYGLAIAVLRPVDSMRARAATISVDEPGARLPVPAADDELGRLGATLNDMLERVERALVHERALTANASHELRTPLSVLKGELELALRHDRPRDELLGTLRAAVAETDRLARLADDLLILAHTDAADGALALRPQPVDLDDLIRRVAARFEARATAAGRTIEIGAEPLRLRADPARLEQAISNLLDNALRHGAGRVQISARQAGGRIEIHVSDDGAGFSEDFAAHAFERFRRGSETLSGDGAGLGLAIVDAVARAHHGSTGADGADVWMSLPT
jgi:two-component system OmpR family sensor kinase